MAITTWISEHEWPSMSTVQDKELNEVFQQVRQKYPGKFLIQSHRYDNRTWFDRMTGNYIRTGTIYTLYNMLNKIDAQVINFPPGESNSFSINTSVHKSYLMTFFFGLLAAEQI